MIPIPCSFFLFFDIDMDVAFSVDTSLNHKSQFAANSSGHPSFAEAHAEPPAAPSVTVAGHMLQFGESNGICMWTVGLATMCLPEQCSLASCVAA